MLNRMLRYADAIVKRGVDKLIDAIAHTPEPQTKNTETPQPQKSMGSDTDCAPQTTWQHYELRSDGANHYPDGRTVQHTL